MTIKIGSNNKIKNSNVIDNNNLSNRNKCPKESFANRHPIIAYSVIASIIMMFTFWNKISENIKNLF
ncbi:hypothetical protein [Clostridioides difficile]|uniref:hypothetical protein n=1 Tax=Clostridioides difficile TaxID=1496 RepID=UPI00097FF0F6|nr:hypothetical protein [Clostridioides difficile]MBY2231550.1 hypothetical protein [Clostridioides difficile]MCI9996772.1 hypothetical protein [Clostridioides difficile]MCR1463327.1 hypothetical protein [Clostridioides difficile]MCU5871836.1 hypothetical protein [Clostridioides difficile]MCU5898160.1 hypothetical protein [Clostridioides difficile]